jgi:hypothetical protein
VELEVVQHICRDVIASGKVGKSGTMQTFDIFLPDRKNNSFDTHDEPSVKNFLLDYSNMMDVKSSLQSCDHCEGA